MLMVIFLKKFSRNRKSKLKNEVQIKFLKRMDRLLTNGYSLLDALNTIAWDPELKPIAHNIISHVKKGSTIDEAFDQSNFHSVIVSHLYLVQLNNDLQLSIRNCITMFESRNHYIQKFKQVMRYPFLLLFIFLLLLLFIKNLILPSFLTLLQSSQQAFQTVQMSLIAIDLFITFLILCIILLPIGFYLWQNFKKHLPIEQQLKIYNKIPFYRSIIRMQTSFQFASNMQSLLKTGLSFKEIFSEMTSQKQLPIVAYYSKLMKEHLEKGLHLPNLISNLPMLDDQLTSFFESRTNAEALNRDLQMYVEILLEKIQENIMKAITIIQPTFFVIIATCIVSIYVILLWPLFQLMNTM